MGGLCLFLVASDLHNPVYVGALLRWLDSVASGGGFDRFRLLTRPAEVNECRGILFILATGGIEHVVLDSLEEYTGPVVVVGLPYANSVSSLAELSPILRGRASIIPLPGMGKEYSGLVTDILHGLNAASRIRGSKIVLIGEPSPWLLHDPLNLVKKLGVRVEVMSVDDFINVFRDVDGWDEALRVLERAEESDLAPGEPNRSIRVARAVFDAVKRLGGDAVSPACIRFLRYTGANACLAHALQGMGGIVVGCEGDVAATLSLQLASYTIGGPAWQANIAGAWRNRLLLAHCSAPIDYSHRFRLRRHFITGGSVTVESIIEADWVTLLRLDPGGARATIVEARVIDNNPGYRYQCETQLLVEANGVELVRRGSGNHYAVIPGRLGFRLSVAVESLGLEAEHVEG